MSTAKLAQRMWWVGALGWTLLAAAAIYWATTDIVLIEGGNTVMLLLGLLVGGGFLAGLAHAWFGWFSMLTDRLLRSADGAGPPFAVLLSIAGVALSPAALFLVLRSVGDETSPSVFGVAWVSILVLLGGCLAGLRRWTFGYEQRSS